MDFGNNCESVVVHIPAGVVLDNVNGGSVVDIGDGYYRINFNGDNNNWPTNVSFKRSNDQVDCQSAEIKNGLYISEKVVHNW